MIFFIFLIQGENVLKEVQSIMGSSVPQVRYSPYSRSLSSSPLTFASSPSTSRNTLVPTIPHRPKRKKNSSYALEKYADMKGKTKAADTHTFQKKLVVFANMGNEAPSHFTRKERHIIMRGLLPEIPVNSSEEHVRREVRDVINPSAGRYFPLKYLFGTCLNNFLINHSHTVLLLHICQCGAERWGDLKKNIWRCCTKCYLTGRG